MLIKVAFDSMCSHYLNKLTVITIHKYCSLFNLDYHKQDQS